MEAWITDWMSQFGYFGVFLLILLENIFPPIPSEVILTLGGFMTTTTAMTQVWCDYCFDVWICHWSSDFILDRNIIGCRAFGENCRKVWEVFYD